MNPSACRFVSSHDSFLREILDSGRTDTFPDNLTRTLLVTTPSAVPLRSSPPCPGSPLLHERPFLDPGSRHPFQGHPRPSRSLGSSFHFPIWPSTERTPSTFSPFPHSLSAASPSLCALRDSVICNPHSKSSSSARTRSRMRSDEMLRRKHARVRTHAPIHAPTRRCTH